MTKNSKLDAWLYIFFAGLVGFSYVRLFYGVDFTDEGFYVALPYRFVLGTRPILDDISIYQSSGTLLTPFLRLYHFLIPDNSGVVLYFRHLYLLFVLAITWISARHLFGEIKSLPLTLLFATPCFLFIPYGIPNLSYNTMGSGFFILGLIFMYACAPRRAAWYFVAGILHAFAVLAYPPLAIAVVVCIPLFVALARDQRRKALGWYLGASLGLGILRYFTLEAKLPDYLATIQAILRDAPTTDHTFGIEKITTVLQTFWSQLPPLWAIGAFLCLVLILKNKLPKFKWVAFTLYPFFLFFFTRGSRGSGGVHSFILFSVILFPLLFPFAQNTKELKRLFNFIFLPCLIAAAVMSVSSNNRLLAAASVLVVGFSLVQYFIFHWQFRECSIGLALVPILLNTAVITRYNYNCLFQEDPIGVLNHSITEGPYKFLHTTEAKAAFYYEAFNAIRRLPSGENTRILFYPHFPAGYLMTKIPPGSYHLCGLCNPITSNDCIDSPHADIVVQFSSLYYTSKKTTNYEKTEPNDIIGYHLESDHPSFKIYAKNHPVSMN